MDDYPVPQGFTYLPEAFGILIPVSETKLKIGSIKDSDLQWLNAAFQEFEWSFKPITYRDLLEFFKQRYTGKRDPEVSFQRMMMRLWHNGYVLKFATSLHTQSDRPNYVSYYIWPDKEKYTRDQKVPEFYYEGDGYE